MMKKYIMEKRFSPFLKVRGKGRVAKLLTYAGIETSPNIWIGSRLLLILLFGIVGAVLPFALMPFVDLSPFGIPHNLTLLQTLTVCASSGLIFASMVTLIIYMHLYYLIRERANRVDIVLPDFLLMIAANMRSGMTPFEAFRASTRPEFGPLQKEVEYISSVSMGTESFADSLKQLTMTIDSAMLRRVILFFENGLRSGGKIANLIETSAAEIRETDDIKRQMMINTKSYVVFIVFILLLGLPLLLAISTQFLTVFSKVQAEIGTGDNTSSLGANIPKPRINIDVKFIDQLSAIIIIGTALLTAVLIGIIAEGKILYGVKYSIPLMVGSYFFFYLFKLVISNLLGAIV